MGGARPTRRACAGQGVRVLDGLATGKPEPAACECVRVREEGGWVRAWVRELGDH